jgi:DNA-binding MarR family transcriptional regulator
MHATSGFIVPHLSRTNCSRKVIGGEKCLKERLPREGHVCCSHHQQEDPRRPLLPSFVAENNVAIDNEGKDRYTQGNSVARSNEERKRRSEMAEQLSTGALLREVARLHVALQRTCVAYCGGTTTTQCTVLTELGRSGPVTLATLSRRIGFDKSWTSRAVENLVQEGLVEKVPSKEDRRTVRLSLTAAGTERLTDLNQTLNTLAERAFDHIPAEQHASVREALELLQQALLTITNEDWYAGGSKGGATCGCE